jgi:hypothetical protein
MKKIILVAVVVLAQMVSAQDIKKSLGDFTSVKAFDQIDVLLVKSSENKIEIKGSRAADVEVVTKNDDLKIRMKLTKLLQGEDISITVYYKGNITSIEASEGARIASQDTFKAIAFEVSAKEGAEIKINLDVQKLKSKANSGGILNLNGTAGNHDVTITSGGILKGRELVTKQTAITINAGGEADINASEFVDAKTRAGGDINIYGNPTQVDQKTMAGGRIEVMK